MDFNTPDSLDQMFIDNYNAFIDFNLSYSQFVLTSVIKYLIQVSSFLSLQPDITIGKHKITPLIVSAPIGSGLHFLKLVKRNEQKISLNPFCSHT